VIVHLVTDRRRLSGRDSTFAGARDCLLRQVAYAIEARVDVVQLRERDLEAADLARLTMDAVALARGSGTRVVVNDRLDVALAAGAAGVHLRGDSMAPRAARSIAPLGFLIGRSVHAVEDAVRSAADVDYLIAGTVWDTESKAGAARSHPLLGVRGLAAVAAAVRVPIIAIGGVTAERVPALAGSGAAGVAAIGFFMSRGAGVDCGAISLRDRVQAIRTRFDTSKRAS
jgi:thiamine-phosphate pyrophosphorylase